MKPASLILLAGMLLAPFYAPAQKKGGPNMEKFTADTKRLFEEKIGEVFYPVEEWKCFGGGYFDLNKATTPTILYFGFEGCAPCRSAFPAFADAANDSRYKGYSFVYLTFDDSATIAGETTRQAVPVDKIKIVKLDDAYMHRKKMIVSYPTVYFINADRTVKFVWTFTQLNGDLASKEYWYSLLDQLK